MWILDPDLFMSTGSVLATENRKAKRTRIGIVGAVVKGSIGTECCKGRNGKIWVVPYLANGMLERNRWRGKMER